MTDLQKFFADAERIKKHDNAIESIISLFVSNNRGMGTLPDSFADYWKKTYIDTSSAPESEPSKENIDRLGAMQSLLDGEQDFTEMLTISDWKELSALVNYEAEDIPMNILEKMMMIFVEKKALNS